MVEGAGDHVAEYMTGGTLVVLGPTGRNVAAGMSGGTAYFYDPAQTLATHLAAGDFDLDVLDLDDEATVREIVQRFADETGSVVAREILTTWSRARMDFVRVQSMEYRRALEQHHG